MEQENTYPTEYRFAVLPDDRSTVIEKARQDYSCGVRSIERILSGGEGLRQSGSILRIKAEYLRAGSRGSNGYAANSSPASERLSLEVADTLTTVFDAAARELERQLPPASLDDLLFGALPFWTFSFLFSLPQAQRFQWELSCAQYWFYAYRANKQRTVEEYAPGETLAGKLGAAELLKAAYRWATQAMDAIADDIHREQNKRGTYAVVPPGGDEAKGESKDYPTWLHRYRGICTKPDSDVTSPDRYRLFERAWQVHRISTQTRYLEALGFGQSGHKDLSNWLLGATKEGSSVDQRVRKALVQIAAGELEIKSKLPT